MPPTLPYLPVRVDCILPPTSLRAADGTILNLPGWRLNLVCCKDDTLYVVAPVETSSVYAFKIHRGGPLALSLHLDRVSDIGPNRHINNVVCTDAADGRSFLLATGGDPREQVTNGSLTILELPGPSSASDSRSSLPSRTKRIPSVGKTIALPCQSTWGLDALPGTNLIAVSSNSHVVLLYKLCAPQNSRCDYNLLPVSTLNGHFNNIPTVAFSPASQNPKLLLSGSIDTSFCIFDVESGGTRLYQDNQARPQVHDFLSAQGSCWSVCWLMPDAIKPIEMNDPLWRSVPRPKCPLGTWWLDSSQLFAARSAVQPNGTHTLRCCVSSTSLPVYSDDDLAAEHAPGPDCESDADLFHDCDSSRHEIYEPVDINPTSTISPKKRPYPIVATALSTGMEQSYGHHRDQKRNHRIYVDCVDPAVEERHFVVGRQDVLYLYRLGKNGSGGYRVEELQRIKPIKDESGTISARGMLRLAHVIQVPKLCSLIVAQQGGRVALVRLLSSTTSDQQNPGDSEQPRVFMMMEQLIGSDNGPIAGMCVNPREDDCYELFVVRARGTCECYELSRRKEAGFDFAALVA